MHVLCRLGASEVGAGDPDLVSARSSLGTRCMQSPMAHGGSHQGDGSLS